MAERAPYSRVYWTIPDDPKFADIYDNNNHLAAWLRMLLAADQAHPASASIPPGCRKASVDALVAARLIRVTGSRFRLVGLDVERQKRSDSARSAAALRWQSERNASASERDSAPHDSMRTHTERSPSGMPRRDETRQDEKNKGDGDSTGRERARMFGLPHPEKGTA